MCGRNHAYIFLNSPIDSCTEKSCQGFITSDGKFVNRKEACRIAFEAGQTKELKELLFSEDITGDNPWAGEIIDKLKQAVVNLLGMLESGDYYRDDLIDEARRVLNL